MGSDRKRRRQLEAAKQKATADKRKVYSLSFGLLRSEALHEMLLEEMKTLNAKSERLADIKKTIVQALEDVENNDFIRIQSLLAFHLGALYAVVEKWTKWNFVDFQVSVLLADTGRVKVLKGYRNAIFHLDRHNAKGILNMLADPKILCWTKALSEAIREALRKEMPHR